jgi:hypothetical protein
MKPPAKVTSWGYKGFPPHTISFTLSGGERLQVKLTAEQSKNFTLSDMREHLKTAAANAGYESLILTKDRFTTF